MANPFREEKPISPEIVAQGKFYLADETGRQTSSFGQRLLLTSTYLWIDETLSIPLGSITELTTTKRSGSILYWDAIAEAEMGFHFTFPGFIRPRMDLVTQFLQEIDQQRELQPESFESHRHTPDDSPVLQADSCEECGLVEANIYTFSTFKFIGIAPVAFYYKLTPLRFVLCEEHARSRVHHINIHNALVGYLGFPGFLAAPWYIAHNFASCDDATC